MQSPNEVEIRSLRNLADAYKLWFECNIRVDAAISPREEGWQSYFAKHPDRFVSAYDTSGKLIGTCAVFYDGRKAGIYRLAVLDKWRRTGIAKRLLAQAEKRSREDGMRGIYALVETTSEDASKMFSKYGYSQMEEVRYYTKTLD